MIRTAQKTDIPDILNLLGQVNNVHAEGRPDLFVKDRTKYSAPELETLISDDNHVIFVFCDENDPHVAGYAFCELNIIENDHNLVSRREIYIDDICVDETKRGNHIGTELYRHVRKFASENDFSRITLNVWSLNPAAENFYRSLGMKVFKLGMEDIL